MTVQREGQGGEGMDEKGQRGAGRGRKKVANNFLFVSKYPRFCDESATVRSPRLNCLIS